MLEQIKERLLKDLRFLHIETEGFSLVLKPYSSAYFGRYNPKTKQLIAYVYQDKECTTLYEYEDLFQTVLHEAVHHIQWSDPNYVRIKGVMHNPDFHRIYEGLLRRHNLYKILRRKHNDTIH